MAKATSFVFDNYRVGNDKRSVQFAYTINFDGGAPLGLVERLIFPIDIAPQDPVIAKLLGALHVGLGISYYKLFLPPRFELQIPLSSLQASFWNEVYLNGLAEFLYTNKLDPSQLAKFTGSGSDSPDTQAKFEARSILALGGGKDSVVAGELLKAIAVPLSGFVLGTGEQPGQTAAVARDMGLELLGVNRQLDPQILELNKRDDTYNGHVPVSMVFALAGLLLCAASGQKYLAVGNEASASIPNTEWQGLTINHQWSKSYEFEKSLQAFVQATISTDLWYFSAIRPLSSVAVAKLFAKHPIYLSDFTSCNRVFLIDPARRPNGRWCGECAKCLSSFIILAPWLEETKLLEIFDKNMLDDSEQITPFLALTGIEGHKPLDCVGTEQEMLLSLNLIAQQNKFSDTQLMRLAQERGIIRDNDWQGELRLGLEPGQEHAFPPELSDKLLTIMKTELA